MSIISCYQKVRDYVKASGLSENITEGRLREMARQMETLGGDSLTPAQFAEKAQNLVNTEQARWAAKKQAQNAIILAKREKALTSILGNKASFENQAGMQALGNKSNMAYEAFRSWLEGGSLRPGVESNMSVEKMQKSVSSSLRSFFNEAVAPVKDAAASGALDRDMLQELDALDRHQPLMQSQNSQALEYAKAFKAVRDKIFELKQANNPFLEKADEYLTKQFHNRERITADGSDAGKEAWLTQAMKTFGDRSFPENTIEEKQEIFKEIYDRIADGKWGSVMDDSNSDKFMTIRGDGGNIMRRMSQSRQLIAKDWQTFYDYQSKYGPKTLAEGLDKVLDSASRDIALLSKFGPNPAGMYEGLYQRTLSKLKGTDAEDFRASKPTLDKKFDIVTGSQNAPARGTLAKFTQGAMTAQYLAKTGSAALRSLPDIALSGSLMRDLNGHTVFSNAAEIAAEYSKAIVPGGYAKERLTDLGLFSKAAHAELMRSLGASDDQPGMLAGTIEKLGSLNILNRHVDAMASAMGTVLTKHLGDQSTLRFTELPGSWKQGMARYGIDENAWNVMRFGRDEINGHTALTPEAIERLPDEMVENYLRKSKQFVGDKAPDAQVLNYGRSQLALKLGTMINEHADLGSAHPDTRQRAFLWGDTNINQGWGMLARLLTQFKTAAVVSSDIYRRGYFSGQSPKGDYFGVAQHMIMAGFMWTLGEYANQLASGKTPEDPTTPEFMTKMMAGSGFAGIWGDTLMNEMQRQGIKDKTLSVAKSFLGPTLSTAMDASAIGLQTLEGLQPGARPDRSLPSKATSLFLSNIPGQNLFYTRAAFNYYIANALHEFMGPGYLSHLEQRTAQTPALGGGQQKYLFARPTGSSFLGE